jgi:hypothetical protein
MNLTEVKAFRCGYCLKLYSEMDRELAAACCSCPKCGAAPSRYCGLFKVCRVCHQKAALNEAQSALAKAKENVALNKKWLQDAEREAARRAAE